MTLKVEQKQPPKVLCSVRLSVAAAGILEELTEAYGSTQAFCIEALINAYGAEYFLELGINEADLQLFRPVGCDYCKNTGYRGRTGIHEVLIGTEEMKALVMRKPGAAEVRELAMTEGTRTLVQDGVAKVFAGQCDLVQVRAVAIS
jgi:type II secretory ATPase GspE/PulE/Tfp pilus assembly ATPase PilB-like protein